MATRNLHRNKGFYVRYDALATVYDRIMSHVEYDEWITLLDNIVKKYFDDKTEISVLELGGGTGVLGEKLIKNGFIYQGSDYSFSMAKQSIKRRIPFICADARQLPYKKRFDCVLFLYDGINYLASLDEYVILFQEVAGCLKDGGIFLFDITTEYNSRKHFYDYVDIDEFDDCSIIRHSYYDELTTTQHNDFTIFNLQKNSTSLYEKYKEYHEQKVLPPKLIEETIPTSKYEILGIFDEFKMRRYSSRSERVHFLLKRRCRT
jgi:SAM-dependent methyltransferase